MTGLTCPGALTNAEFILPCAILAIAVQGSRPSSSSLEASSYLPCAKSHTESFKQ